jgi:hypothetical protein
MFVTALPELGDIKALTLARDGKAFQLFQASNFPLGGPQLQASMPRNSTDYFAFLHAQSRQFSLFTILLPCILYKRHRT